MADLHVTLKKQKSEDVDAERDDVYRAAHRLEEAKAIHQKYPLFDGHNDLPWALREGYDYKLGDVDLASDQSQVANEKIRHKYLHTDIPRAREGGMGAQFWSVYVSYGMQGPEAVQATLEQIDVVHRLCEKYPETFEFASSASEVRRIFGEGRIACTMGAEGGHQMNDSMAVLRMYHRLGVRYMTLTHNGGPVWADPAVDYDGSWAEKAPNNGLSPFGVEVVHEMNRMGMIVDVSHVHEKCMHAVLDVTKAPVMFSHSSSKALCDHPRDVPDEVVKRTMQNGGVIMINFASNFIAGAFWVRGGQVGATLMEVADHIDHIKAVCGGSCDHIGIGADYDGIVNVSRGLGDVSKVPYLTAELLERGYSEEECGKILGLNALRVMEKCEEVSKALKAVPGSVSCDKKLADVEPHRAAAVAAAAAAAAGAATADSSS